MIQTVEMKSTNGTGKEKKKNKLLKIILITLGSIIGAFALLLIVLSIVNVASLKSELKKIEPYGQHVTVDGKQMNVFIQGEGAETIVLLPGYGTASPTLDFKLLIDELAPFYKVVSVEPFGYGLSDGTDKERTTENIVSEVHEALQQLNIDRFILMGHSIAGIYGLDYANKYPNELIAFVGIDTSVPNQPGMDKKMPTKLFSFAEKSGVMRLIKKVGGDPYASFGYDDKTREQLRLISNKNSSNATNMNEMVRIGSNFKDAEGLTFPKDLPRIFFIQANNPGFADWIPLHEAQVKDAVHGKVMTFDGDHYLHHTKSKEIVENFRKFMSEIK